MSSLEVGKTYHGVKVLRRLGPDTQPREWPSYRGRTLLVTCPACGEDVRAHESHVRLGKFKHAGRYKGHSFGGCTERLDVDSLLEELEAEGDLV